MAQLPVDPATLRKTIAGLESVVNRLKASLERLEAVVEEGFVLTQAPPINDAIPSLIQFAALVDAKLDVLDIEEIYGKSARTKRDERRGIGVKSKKKTK